MRKAPLEKIMECRTLSITGSKENTLRMESRSVITRVYGDGQGEHKGSLR
jgi:hypothetical protein